MKKFCGMILVAAGLTGAVDAATNYFATAGSTNWICPAGVSSVQVECWGGGGAGGGAQRFPQTSGTACGGGGAGGAYARYNSYSVTPGNTYYINVGAGGVSVMIDSNTVPGGDSWFNTNNTPSTIIIAKGGAGGETVMLQTTSGRYGEGGAGTTSGSTGDVVYAGGDGAKPSSNTYGGSGGGSGGTGSAGNSGSSVTNTGATAVTGGGNGGDANASGSGVGRAPTAPPGGGGGGARSANSTPTMIGGTGSVGRVVLTYAVNIAPSVSLTAPANGASFTSPASIAMTATASDTDGTVTSVDFYNGATLLGSDASSPYAYTWTNVPAGSYSLTARATDNSNAVSTSAVAIITVTSPSSNSAPSVSLTAPANGASFTVPASIAMTATASDMDGTVTSVDFYNGATLLGSDASSPYAYTWTNVPAGLYSLTARATDNSNAVSTSAVAVITVTATNNTAGTALNNSVWAFQGSSGRILRQPDTLGNRVLDYSGVGYKGGTVPIPVVAAKTNLSPVAGDNGPRIQAAINYVSGLPLVNGFRGAVFLSAGEYPISNSITISASGVVLRGAGASTNGTGTILRAAGARPTASDSNEVVLINISGSGSGSVSGTARSITNTYVPVGALSFNVSSNGGLTVGGRVLITRDSTANWIADIGMDKVDPAWTAGKFDVESERIITRIEGTRVTIDAPLTCAIESKYGGATIQPYSWSGRISNVGIEDIFGVSDYNTNVTSTVGSSPAYPADEQHVWIFINSTAVENAWVQRVTVKSFAYSCVTMDSGTRNMTVRDCISLDPVSIIDGGRRYAFGLRDAQNCLVQNCYTRKDRHQFATDSLDTGPNVFVDGNSDIAYNECGPHFRWGTGAMWDNVTVNGDSDNGVLAVRDRGNNGTSHGWAGANEVVWNSTATNDNNGGFTVENPPTARNWLIGSLGQLVVNTSPGITNMLWGAHPPPGTYDSRNTNVFPNSLYYAQLQDRLAAPNRETREYWLGVIDGFTNTISRDVVALDSAWSNAVKSIASGQPLNPFNVVTNNHWIPFTFNYSLGATDQVVAATLSLSFRAISSATNDAIYLGSTNNSFTFSSLGWLPIGTGTNTTVRMLDLNGQLNWLTNGQLNVAVQGDAGIDWAMLELQVAPAQASYTNSVLPKADAYVRGGTYQTNNYGADTTIVIRTDTSANNKRQAYLRWDLAGRATNILQARIRLTPISVDTNGYEHGIALVTNSNWSESTINWTNQPGGGKRFATWVPAANVPVEFVVTPQVQAALDADGNLSLELFSVANAGTGMVSYASSEYADSAYRPQLLLVYSGTNSAVLSVSLTSPDDGAIYTEPASIAMTADASSATGTITTVGFYSGTNLLGSDASFPYAYTWTNVVSGSYNLTARATENSGAVCTSAVAAITVLDPTYTLTVNSGAGDGNYTNGTQVAISANAISGKAFVQWTGDTQYVNNVTYTNALVTMSTNPVTLTATYVDVYYTLTVNNGTGGSSYTNGTKVSIAANAPAAGKAFSQWTGDTAYVANSNSASSTVTMSTRAITLTATYVDVYYALTVTGGTGGGSYTNARQVAISANAPAAGKAFYRWTGDTQYVNNVTYTNALVTMSTNPVSLSATYVDVLYTLTVTGGSGSGTYTNGYQVAIAADAPATGKTFSQWIGDTQVVNDVTYTNALVTMSTNPVTLSATYVDVLYTLTVTGGTGAVASATNGTQVAISADAPAFGMTFDKWTGDTQYVAGVSSSNTTVTMPAQAVALSSTYKILPGYYTLTVSNGTGGGIYSNGVQVTVTAVAPAGTAFDRWTGDTQIVAGVFSLSTIVTMPAQDAALTASCADVSNGVASVEWTASAGFYFDADPNVGILGDGTGNKTITQLMYSPDNVKDNILSNRAGAVNDVVWDTITVTENGVPGDYDDYAYFAPQNCTRALTNGYVYALIFQDNNVQPGDWYYSTPLVAIDTNTSPQSIEMNTDTVSGDPIDGPYGAQVIAETVTYTLTANGGIGGTISPTNASVLAGNSTNFVIIASNYYRISTLATNGTALTGMSFDNLSTNYTYAWNNVQAAGTVTVAFAAQVVTNAANTPYEWLAGYGLTNYDTDANADQDMDGLKAWQEYIAGTNPTNAASVLKAAQVSRNVITWSPVTGRVYSVYWSTNLVKGFQSLETNIVHPQSNYTNGTPDSRVNHYQLKVRMQ